MHAIFNLQLLYNTYYTFAIQLFLMTTGLKKLMNKLQTSSIKYKCHFCHLSGRPGYQCQVVQLTPSEADELTFLP